MKIFIGLVLTLLIQKATFAHPELPSASSKDTTVQQQKTIDSLNVAAFNIYLGSPDSARAIAEKALLLAEKLKYKEGIGRSFLNIGYVYWSQSYYSIALFYLNKALVYLPADKPLYISECYSTMGRTYADLENYDEANKNLDKSEIFAGKDPDHIAETYSERAYVEMNLKNYSKAIAYAKHSLALNRIAKDDISTAVIYGRLSDIYNRKKEYPKALAYCDTAYQMSITTRNNRLRANSYVEYALIYTQLRNFDKAIENAKKGAQLASNIGVVDALSGSYRIMINAYEEKNDLKGAMASQKRYDNVRDSLNNFSKAKNTELIQSYFALNARLTSIEDFEHREAEIKARVKMQLLIIISLTFALLVLAAILSVTWYFYKQRKQLNDELESKNDVLIEHKHLIEAQTENLQNINRIKDKLLAVIGHDLRTPLANLRNILELFDADFLSVNEVHVLMKDLNPQVKSAELTLTNLMDWVSSHIKGRNVNSSKLDIFLLGVEMEQTFNHALRRKDIEFLNQATAGQSVLADENHIKVVLRNLISNAIKFTNTKGCIKLNSIYKENRVIISIQDNGKGMSLDEVSKLFSPQTHFSQPGTLGENGTGIGLLLCKELVELNGGKMWISSKTGMGSTFYFSLPLDQEYA